MMGSSSEEISRLVQRYGENNRLYFEGEIPQHQVTISQPFYLGKYPVTQGEWEAVMGENPSRYTGDPNRPVESVSWNNVQEFIDKLNERESGRRWRYRLPTEAEWEYACRAWMTTEYSFGDDPSQLGEYAWYYDNAGSTTHPVGQLKPNPWGLHDMHGNVWEWVQDWCGLYSSDAVTDPQGPGAGEYRVLRGGSFLNLQRLVRCAYRHEFFPQDRGDRLGFRVVLLS